MSDYVLNNATVARPPSDNPPGAFNAERGQYSLLGRVHAPA